MPDDAKRLLCVSRREFAIGMGDRRPSCWDSIDAHEPEMWRVSRGILVNQR
jgi:hypothetical protein